MLHESLSISYTYSLNVVNVFQLIELGLLHSDERKAIIVKKVIEKDSFAKKWTKLKMKSKKREKRTYYLTKENAISSWTVTWTTYSLTWTFFFRCFATARACADWSTSLFYVFCDWSEANLARVRKNSPNDFARHYVRQKKRENINYLPNTNFAIVKFRAIL